MASRKRKRGEAGTASAASKKEVAAYHQKKLRRRSTPTISAAQHVNSEATRSEHIHSLPYIYLTLAEGHIRVLCLEPGAFGSPLCATLEHVSIEDACDTYEAISYAWGEPMFSQQLYISGRGVVNITESLHSAFQHLRNEDAVRRLWADGVCIDQANISERSLQVAIMTSIYRAAEGLLVWLGPSQPDDAVAFATLAAIEQLPGWRSDLSLEKWEHHLRQLDHDLRAIENYDCSSGSTFMSGGPAVAGLHAGLNLLKRSWFSRMWVVQEVIAKNDGTQILCCGEYSAHWRSLETLCSLAWEVRHADPSRLLSTSPDPKGLAKLMASEQRFYDTFHSFDWGPTAHAFDAFIVLDILVACSHRHCLDPRDRVFSLSGVQALDALRSLRPDYSLSTRKIYEEFSLALLNRKVSKGGTIHVSLLLGLVGTECVSQSRDALPSWVPVYHHFTERTSAKWQQYYKIWIHSPRNGGMKGAIRSKLASTVQYRGRRFGQITQVMHDSGWPQRSNDGRASQNAQLVDTFTDWFVRCRDFVRVQMGDSYLDQDLVRLLTCELEVPDSADGSPYDDASLRKGFSKIWQDVRSQFRTSMECFLPFLLNPANTVLDTDRYLCHVEGVGFKFVAWVPKCAIIGDSLCVLEGSPFPITLRENSDASFAVLGDAFSWPTRLRQALGGSAQSEESYDIMELTNGWSSEWLSRDREMRGLIRALDWIKIR